QTLTLDLSDPLRPLVSPNRSLLDRLNQNNFAYSGSYLQEDDDQKIASVGAEYDWTLGSVEGRLKAGLSRSESTKGVATLNAPNVLNNYVIPGLNKTFAAATAAEKATFMQGIMTPTTIPALTRNAGQGYPTEFLVADRDFVLGTLGALEANKASPVVAPSSYANTETVDAFYVQTDLETQLLGRTLRANVGVRVAETTVDSDTVTQGTAGNWVPVQLNGKYTDTLPSFSFAYDVLKNVVWRGAWGKTLTPNRVSDISQALRLGNASQFAVTAGNSDLQPERSTGQDTALEWYPDKSSVLALGYFERKVTGFGINQTTQVPFNQLGLDIALWQPAQQAILLATPTTPIDVTRKVNSPDSYKIKGYEFAYSQAFRFLPYPFNGLGGTVSITKVDSAGIARTIAGQRINLPDLPPQTYALTGFYELGPFSARVSYTHKDDYADTFTTDMNAVGFNKWNSKRSYTDLTIGYKVLKNLELRLDVINLTKTKTYTYFKRFVDVGQGSATGPVVNYGDDTSRIENGYQAGRTIQLTLRGSF
ncbi:MAG: TonB-dependent receptor, partial [Chitinophagaceae bacterium]|nr:TonB-dependent receptor [Rubrivivax sp.]